MAGKDTREVELVVLTDRVALPEENLIHEWSLNEPLHTMPLAVTYSGGVQPVYLIANRQEHMSALVAVGSAMACMAGVHEADWARPNTDYRAKRAYRAQSLVANARNALIQDWRDELLNHAVFMKLQRCLDDIQKSRAPFTKDWEIGAPLCAALSLDCLSGHAGEMRRRYFGSQPQTPGSVRTDRHRAGLFFDEIKAGRSDGLLRAPQVHLAELTEKYLNAVLPMMLPGYTHRNLGVVDQKIVSCRGGLVTPEIQKIGHDNHHRPFGTFA